MACSPLLLGVLDQHQEEYSRKGGGGGGEGGWNWPTPYAVCTKDLPSVVNRPQVDRRARMSPCMGLK
jgi:hypothetical protein